MAGVKKKTEEIEDIIGREIGQLGEDSLVKKKSKKQRIDSEIYDDGNKLKKKNKNNKQEKRIDSEAEDGVKKKKKKSNNSEVDVIGNSESSKVCEKSIVSADDDNKKKRKRKRNESDLGAEENSEGNETKKKKKASVDSVADENNKDSIKDAKTQKKKKLKQSLHSEVEETSFNSTEDAIKENKPSENSEFQESNKDSDAKKLKQSVDSEVEETSFNSTEDAKMENKLSEALEVEENINDTDAKKQKKKKKKKKKNVKQSVDSQVKEIANKKSKEKKPSADPESEENDLNSTKNSKKKRTQSKVSEVEENNKDSMKDAKKKSKEKKPNEDSVADENDSTKDAKKKRRKKQESGKSDKDVVTPSSKSNKRVKFSDSLEIFPAEDEEVKVVRGKRYSKEEDDLIKGSVLDYIENHALGDEGIKMVMECQSYPQTKGCWKEIASAIPWRTCGSVYERAHTLFEAGSRGVWTKEDLELVIDFQKKHGNDWRTIADAMGKHRKHVKDAWRRMRLASKKKGHWTREEYQGLFDLVNKDIKMKAFQEKHSKHGMLRDNIPWMAISDKLESRDHVTCCAKWYDQLQSPMIAKGIWANVDDYRLLEELLKLDAACIDDVDWDNLLDNRDGEACRKRWNQMVLHIGSPGSKTFAEQVEVLSERYCPDLAEDREDFDNRPYDPED